MSCPIIPLLQHDQPTLPSLPSFFPSGQTMPEKPQNTNLAHLSLHSKYKPCKIFLYRVIYAEKHLISNIVWLPATEKASRMPTATFSGGPNLLVGSLLAEPIAAANFATRLGYLSVDGAQALQRKIRLPRSFHPPNQT